MNANATANLLRRIAIAEAPSVADAYETDNTLAFYGAWMHRVEASFKDATILAEVNTTTSENATFRGVFFDALYRTLVTRFSGVDIRVIETVLTRLGWQSILTDVYASYPRPVDDFAVSRAAR